jgi:GDPmannose 4,6-dehydratase
MADRKTALVTGITGQDGSYLTDLLLAKGYRVIGMFRRSSTFNFGRIDAVTQRFGPERFKGVYGDLADTSSIKHALAEFRPDEIYNLGAQSHVGISFDIPEYTSDTTGMGTVRLLDAIRALVPNARYYQASSSELYGDVKETPQSETTPFNPVSPYACAKAYAFYITQTYRRAYGLYAVNGILFNHESPRRGENFLPRKVTTSLAAIHVGLADKLVVGNLNAKRDWGYAPDYVECMHAMLQQDEPDDYVIATGEAHSVREFIELAATRIGITLEWRGSGLDETAVDTATGREIVGVSERYFRPAEVDKLCGNPSKAVARLGWNPRKTTFGELVDKMMKHDLQVAEMMVRLRERWPTLPIDSFKSAFLREIEYRAEAP